MAIKTVTTDNLAEYASERTAKGSELATNAQIVEASERIATANGTRKGPTPGNPVISTGSETLPGQIEPQGSQEQTADAQVEKAKAGTDPAVQKRIDELTRQKKETEEFAEGEYNSRIQSERRIAELEAQLSKAQPKAPEMEKLEPPDPSKFETIADFVVAERAYTDKVTEQKIAQARMEERMALTVERENALLAERIKVAKESIEDFDAVITSADRVKVEIPTYVQRLIVKSTVGPQIAYHLAKYPDDQARIFAMEPELALAALGRIEERYEKKPDSVNTVRTPNIETSRAPAPTAPIRTSEGTVASSTAQASSFQEYKRLRMEENRRKRR